MRSRAMLWAATLVASLLLTLASATLSGADETRLYRDRVQGFEFTYPSNVDLKPLSGAVLLETQGVKWMVSVYDLKSYPEAEFAKEKDNWQAFTFKVARLACDADGPDGSRTCPLILEQKHLKGGNPAVVFTLEEEVLTRTPSGDKSERHPLGPAYGVLLSKPGEPSRILLFMPRHEGPISPAAQESIETVVRSVSALE